MEGKVKWFNEKRNYGFLSTSEGEDFFVHGSEVQGSNPLKQGDKVSFEPTETPRGKKAIKVKLLKKV